MKFYKNKNIFDQVVSEIQKCQDNIYCINGISYDIDYYYPCENGSDCCDDDYCRCGQVIKSKIDISVDRIIENFIHKKTSVVDNYCVDRIIRYSPMINSDNWELDVRHGYYGEEVCGYKLLSNMREQIELFNKIKSLSDIDKIKNLLIYEYGFLLDKLKDCNNTEVKKIKTSDLIIPNQSYSKNLDKETVSSYIEYSLPRAICIKSDNKYSILDGYHRVMASMPPYSNNKNITIIVLS